MKLSADPEMPSSSDVDEQVSKLIHEGKLPKKQAALLRFLIEAKYSGRYHPEDPNKESATGIQVLGDFYWQKSKAMTGSTDAVRSPGKSPVTQKDKETYYGTEVYDKGRALLGDLDASLNRYYLYNSDRLVISVSRGKGGYEPEFFFRSKAFYAGAAGLHVTDRTSEFECLGTNLQAMAYLNSRIPDVKRIEDTTVRWDDTPSFYRGLEFQTFLSLLRDHRRIQYRSVTGPTTDAQYVHGLREVFAGRIYPEIQCFRLHHTAPIMNFVILFDRETDKREVLFGYGIQTAYTDVSQTVVFRSENPRLVGEFQELLTILRNERFSRRIDVTDDDFLTSSIYNCDVLATFPSFPKEEIRQKCKDAKSIIVCVTAWHLLERSFYWRIRNALKRGCTVKIALWDPDSDFMKLREEAINGRPGYPREELAMNLRTLEELMDEYPELQVDRCQGQASVSLFWIDKLMYFSPYWVGKNVSDGPHFLVHESSYTGSQLIKQYDYMLRKRDRTGAMDHLDEAEELDDTEPPEELETTSEGAME